MATPAGDSHQVASGGVIAAGRYYGTPATSLTLTDTVHPRLYQRVGTSKTITVSGASNGTRIQARACPVGKGLTQDEGLYPFINIATNHAGGAFSLPLPVPQGDGWVIQVRDPINKAIGQTGTHAFGVGAFIALIGQSNMENLFSAYVGAFTGAKGALTYHAGFARLGNINDSFTPIVMSTLDNGHGSDYVGSGYTSDPGAYMGTYFTVMGNTLVADLGFPIAFLPRTAGGSSITYWVPGQTYLNALLADVDAIGGDFELAVWLQGESNAGMSAATYQTNLQSLFDACKAHTGRSSSGFHFGVVVVGPAEPDAGSWGSAWSPEGTMGPIRKGQLDFVAANTSNGAFLAGTDLDGSITVPTERVHIDTPSQRNQAARYVAAIERRFAGATYSIEGPKISSALVSGETITVSIQQQGGTLLLDGAGGLGSSLQGFRVFDGGTPVTISSTAISGNTITLTLASAPLGVVTMDYGMMNLPFGHTVSPTSVCYDNQTIAGSSVGLPLQPKPIFTVS